MTVTNVTSGILTKIMF